MKTLVKILLLVWFVCGAGVGLVNNQTLATCLWVGFVGLGLLSLFLGISYLGDDE